MIRSEAPALGPKICPAATNGVAGALLAETAPAGGLMALAGALAPTTGVTYGAGAVASGGAGKGAFREKGPSTAAFVRGATTTCGTGPRLWAGTAVACSTIFQPTTATIATAPTVIKAPLRPARLCRTPAGDRSSSSSGLGYSVRNRAAVASASSPSALA